MQSLFILLICKGRFFFDFPLLFLYLFMLREESDKFPYIFTQIEVTKKKAHKLIFPC